MALGTFESSGPDAHRFVVREAAVRDAEQLLADAQAAMAERLDHLITQPEEFTLGLDEEKSWIQAFIDAENSVLLVAEQQADIIAWASLQGGTRRQKRHTALLGIRQIGRGVGTALTQTTLVGRQQ